MQVRENGFLQHDSSASLGKSVPVEHVPVGFLVLATCPLILWLLDGTVAGFASAVLIIGLFALGLWFLSLGQRRHVAYNLAEVARRPVIPFKLLGSTIIALVVGLLATAKIGVPGIPFFVGLATLILCLVSFGMDPMRDKGLDNPKVRNRVANERLYQRFEERFDELLLHISALQDDDLTERTRMIAHTIMGLIRAVDFETSTLQKLSRPLSKLLDKMEAEADALIVSSDHGSSAFQRRKLQIKLQALADAFEARARKNGIAEGRDSFELQADVLFQRMSRPRHR